MSLVQQLSDPDSIVSGFFASRSGEVSEFTKRFRPTGRMLASAPFYTQRYASLKVVGWMTEYLLKFDLAARCPAPRKTLEKELVRSGAFLSSELSKVCRGLFHFADAHLSDWPEIEEKSLLAAAFALTIGEEFYRSGGQWSELFSSILIGEFGAVNPRDEFDESCVERVRTCLLKYYEILEGKDVFADVKNVVGLWTRLRGDASTQISQLDRINTSPELEFSGLVGGADPDWLGNLRASRALVDLKTTKNAITEKSVFQLASYLMLGGQVTAEVEFAGIYYSRYGELVIMPAHELMQAVMGSADLKQCSARFIDHLAGARNKAGDDETDDPSNGFTMREVTKNNFASTFRHLFTGS